MDSESDTSLDGDLPMGCINSATTSSSNYTTAKKRRNSLGSIDDKAKKKTETAAQKLAKKQKLAEEKLAKQAAREENKIYKPAECMKYMNIELHPSLLSTWYMSDLTREVSASGAKLSPAPDICDPSLVMWTRSVPRKLEAIGDQVELTPSQQSCNKALYIANIYDICHHFEQHTLASHLTQMKEMTGCDVSFVLFGVKDYLKLAKQAFDEQAEFFMRGDNKKCIAVGVDGLGKERLWQQMIAVLPSSSLETSRSLCAQYKSPYILFKALENPNNVKEIADIGVARAAVPGAKSRRLGPEFARKLNILFTSTRGDELLD